MSPKVLDRDGTGGTVRKNLHDLLSIAEIEAALASSKLPSLNDDESSTARPAGETGLGIRLPFLLRCLAACQPRSSVEASFDATDRDESTKRHESSSSIDVDAVVPLLEDVAAAHPGAENVEILVSTLAPSICQDTIGKVPPLSRVKVNNSNCYEVNTGRNVAKDDPIWNTDQLSAALDSLSQYGIASSNKRGQKEHPLPGKRQKMETNENHISSSSICEDNAVIDDSANEDEDEDDLLPSQSSVSSDKVVIEEKQDEFSLFSFFERVSSAANDSYESAMRRTLQELIHLVKSSLPSSRNATSSFDGGAVENEGNEDKSPANENSFYRETGLMTPGLSIKSESLFAETNAVYSAFGGGCSSLSVMVICLMYHAPVLRHDHVATALCRAAVPQAANLIKHMAANCPVAAPCLLRGVIKAYKLAERYKYLKPKASSNLTDEVDSMGSGAKVSDIIQASVESAKSIASLSPSEAFSVICTLKEHEVIDELVLTLLLDHDPVGAASFIVEKLSTTFECDKVTQASSSTAPTARCEQEPILRLSTLSDNMENSMRSTTVESETVEQQRTHSLPLRQRILSRRLQSNGGGSLTKFSAAQIFTQSHLRRALMDDSSLAERCAHCISTKIEALLDYKQKSLYVSSVCCGEAVLLLRAFALLVHCSAELDSKFVTNIIGHIPFLFRSQSIASQMPKSSSEDDLYKLAECVTIIAWSKFLAAEDSEVSNVCQACIRSLLIRPKSLESLVFSSRLSGFVISNDATGMTSIILNQIYTRNHSSAGAPLELKQMSNVICCIQSAIGNEQLEHTYEAALSSNSVLYSPIVAIDVMKRNDLRRFDKLNELVDSIFSDPKSCRDILCKPMTCELIQESVKMVLRRNGPHIPHVVPFSLERVAASIPWSLSHTSHFHEVFAQFGLQLLYALLFLENEPTSPFVINPRSFPLTETLSFVKSLYNDSDQRNYEEIDGHKTLCHLLEKLISSHCADVVHHVESSRLLNHSTWTITGYESVTPSKVHLAVRDCLNEHGVVDQSGIRAEKMYLMSSSHHLTSALDVAVVSALLTSRHSQPKFISYLALCKDPLVLFKTSASVWKRHGIRRIFLKTLHHLLEANESIVIKSCESSRVAREFLAARDSIIVRCLLLAQTDLSQTHCVMSVNMIRHIISRCPGIVATLLKQGLDDRFVDYLCEFVPETFSDVMILSSLLSEKGLLSSSERLALADASLRIAISHSLRGEMAAKRLANASLLVLIESFHLVIGPVGVPVSVLRQVNGQDATDTCRNAMFRMLSMLSTINPNSVLKDCAISAIVSQDDVGSWFDDQYLTRSDVKATVWQAHLFDAQGARTQKSQTLVPVG
eukprot:CCRYP_016701-RB/>CCRYP_016701-RB protein AED:0.07 eAED:0.07 QI:60/0.66/1/1/0.66/0.5/4/103/1342